MSLPTAAGLFKISNLRPMPPILIDYEFPAVSGTTNVIVSGEKPAVDIACNIITPNTAKKNTLKTTF